MRDLLFMRGSFTVRHALAWKVALLSSMLVAAALLVHLDRTRVNRATRLRAGEQY